MKNLLPGIQKRGNAYMFTVSMGRDGNYKSIRKYNTFNPPMGISQKKADALANEEYIKFKMECKGNKQSDENLRFRDLTTSYFTFDLI